MNEMPVVLSIAGSDGSAGAGIQADLKTFSSLKVYGLTVITAITIQNTQGVREVYPQPLKIMKEQLDVLYDDFKIDFVKIGMLATNDIAEFVFEYLCEKNEKYVLDTVLKATAGKYLFDGSFEKLISKAFIVTPNLDEASFITGMEISDIEGMKKAAQILKESGAKYVLIKGGHLKGDEAADVFFDGKNFEVLVSKKVKTPNIHGTGCTLSSAITSYLAGGFEPLIAVRKAKEFVLQSLLKGKNLRLGKGRGPLIHF